MRYLLVSWLVGNVYRPVTLYISQGKIDPKYSQGRFTGERYKTADPARPSCLPTPTMSFGRCSQCTYDYPCINCRESSISLRVITVFILIHTVNHCRQYQYDTQNVSQCLDVTHPSMLGPYHSITQQGMQSTSWPLQLLPRRTIPLPPLSVHTISLNPILRHQGQRRPIITYDLYSPPTSARLASSSSSAHRCYPESENWADQPATHTSSMTIRICRHKEVDLSVPPIVVFPASVYQGTVTIADVLRSTNIFFLNHIQTLVGHNLNHHSSSQVSRLPRVPWRGLYRSMDERDVWLLDVS